MSDEKRSLLGLPPRQVNKSEEDIRERLKSANLTFFQRLALERQLRQLKISDNDKDTIRNTGKNYEGAVGGQQAPKPAPRKSLLTKVVVEDIKQVDSDERREDLLKTQTDRTQKLNRNMKDPINYDGARPKDRSVKSAIQCKSSVESWRLNDDKKDRDRDRKDNNWRRGNQRGRGSSTEREHGSGRGGARNQHSQNGGARNQHSQNDDNKKQSQFPRAARGASVRGGRQRLGANLPREKDNEQDGTPGRHTLTYTWVKNLCNDDPNDIVTELYRRRQALLFVLSRKEIDAGMLQVLIDALTKGLQSRLSKKTLYELMGLVIESDIFSRHLPEYYLRLASHIPMTVHVKFKATIDSSLDMLNTLLTILPSISILKVMQLVYQLKGVIQMPSVDTEIIDGEIRKKVEDLNLRVQEVVAAKNTKPRENKCEEEPPPDDFRDLPILPTQEELCVRYTPYLRANKKIGGYQNVDHYLDVQFRLLREDFVAPLREGIHDYLDPTQKGRNTNIRSYTGVRILAPDICSSGTAHWIQFHMTKGLKRVRWEGTKRLIYGSMVVLSRDNFKTLRFATVVDRKPKDLQNGALVVKFDKAYEDIHDAIGNSTYQFDMIETTAYFEAYKYTLSALKKIDQDTMPFIKNIVNCEGLNNHPSYIHNRTSMDFKFLVGSEVNVPVILLKKDSWPSPEDLGLDGSQHRALMSALTKEFSIIQGPPGTGKTYVGLKLIELLLRNENKWNQLLPLDVIDNDPPRRSILVVCYTNHALDQFMEGIQNIMKKIRHVESRKRETMIVRVGGRSSSQALENVNLAMWRKEFRTGKEFPKAVGRAIYEANQELRELEVKFKQASQTLEKVNNRILSEDILESVIDDVHYQSLLSAAYMLGGTFMGKMMEEWLGYGKSGMMPVEEDTTNNVANPGQLVRDIIQAHLQQPAEPPLGDAVQNVPDRNPEDGVVVQEEIDFIEAQRMLDERRGRGLGFQVPDIRQNPNAEVELPEMQYDPTLPPEYQWQHQRKLSKKKLGKRLRGFEKMSSEEATLVDNVWILSMDERWRLYRLWVDCYCENIREEVTRLQTSYDRAIARLNESRSRQDKFILERATVIGMTTTGAAKHQELLQEVKPSIIIVEEAAEVLESHIVTSLNDECKHLVLIGDHKQLRPSPTVFELARKYNLDISLFERMIENRVDYECLAKQHRMRPEISVLMKHIYPELEDDPCVENYPNVMGVSSNMYFLNHESPEYEDVDSRSHSNEFEAQFMKRLCKYLLLQGYKPSQITILTPYSGQLFEFKKCMPRSEFDGVRITVVDNFQGEENDIILLSLVRSNSNGKIGFLGTANRICVALSRAKIGFYVVGNISHLAAHSILWQKMQRDLEKANKIGEALPLHCQKHPENKVLVKTADDFNKVPEGGCTEPCTYRLECGHTCDLPCHPYDPDHKKVRCYKKCNKELCRAGHRCKRRCFEKCPVQCDILVKKELVRCGHSVEVKCSDKLDQIKCNQPCDCTLSCGHKCKNKCGAAHFPEQCNEMKTKTWPCGHIAKEKCRGTVTSIDPCPDSCSTLLKCGHICKGSCGQCWSGRFHSSCQEKCERTLVCGHFCREPCTSECPPCREKCNNYCPHSRCQRECGKECVKCMEQCSWRCRHYSCTKLCHEPCNRPRCDEPCTRRLRCGHPCIGLCGEKCPRLCRICHYDLLTEVFFGTEDEDDARFIELTECGHIFEVSGLDHWMDQVNEDGDRDIQPKLCPRCKEPIRRHLRYGNVVKQMVSDIEMVKSRSWGKPEENERIRKELMREITDSVGIPKDLCTSLLLNIGVQEFERQMEQLRVSALGRLRAEHQRLARMNKVEYEFAPAPSRMHLDIVNNQLKFVKEIYKIQDVVEDSKGILLDNVQSPKKILYQDIKSLGGRIVQHRNNISEQELQDIQLEVARLKTFAKAGMMVQLARNRSLRIETELTQKLATLAQFMTDTKPFTAVRESYCKDTLNELSEVVPKSGLGISEEERVMITQAMGLGAGHWYKCRNGHVYAIGDCGGATETATCLECKEKVGGTGHQLIGGNNHAPEMDHSSAPAWPQPQLQNPRNYPELF